MAKAPGSDNADAINESHVRNALAKLRTKLARQQDAVAVTQTEILMYEEHLANITKK